MLSLSDLEEARITGEKVNYYFICKRKLWLFDRGIQLEGSSEKVSLGKLLHDTAYPRDTRKEVLIDNLIAIDIISGGNVREVKYSRKMEEADRWQLYYYLFYLEQLGIRKKGVINYPRQKKREFIELTDAIKTRLIEILKEIREILSLPKPPPAEKLPYCTKCAYYTFCFSG
ncbi:CRISPR-associated protein Cas4 [Desulfurobacterium sp.]